MMGPEFPRTFGMQSTRPCSSLNALDELMKAAEQAAREAESWADLSNALFSPVDGLVSRAYRTREAREAFVKTEEFRKIRQLVSDAIERFGLVEGATPKKSVRFLVRLPQSLHRALERGRSEER